MTTNDLLALGIVAVTVTVWLALILRHLYPRPRRAPKGRA